MSRLLFKLKRRLRALFRKAELERELDDELRFHLEKEIEQNLALAATGIYGLISYSIAQRTSEIGIRLALGATRKNIFRMILGQGLRLVLVRLVLGLAGAFALTRLIRSLMFGVTPSDPVTFVAVSVLLIVITIAAGGLPALRATKLDPLKALRD